jgi:hypothetical protein
MMTVATAPALTGAVSTQRRIAVPRPGEGGIASAGAGGNRRGFIIGIITEIF